MTRLLLSGLACCSLLSADFSAPAWRYRRPLSVMPPAPVSQFSMDAALYRDSAANLDDLRIVRDDIETPYVIVSLAGSRRTLEPAATITNKAFVPGVGVQAMLDLRGHHHEHNRLRISSTLHNYKEIVRVETSDDAHSWAVVQSAGLIFDVLRDDHAINETVVSYPTSTRRFLRLTIPGWTDPTNLQSVWLSDLKETGATRDVVVTSPPAVREDSKAQTTEPTLDMGFAGRPFDRIDLTVDPGVFSRTVEIAATNDLRHWNPAGGAAICRTEEGQQLSLDIAERTDRYLKITVFNADSTPLHFGPVTVSGIRRVVKFSSSQPGAYFVYIGNPSAREPSYDFGRVLPVNGTPAASTLGAIQPNPLFRLPERPWTDRNPWLLNGALIMAVLVMGLITLRMLKKVS